MVVDELFEGSGIPLLQGLEGVLQAPRLPRARLGHPRGPARALQRGGQRRSQVEVQARGSRQETIDLPWAPAEGREGRSQLVEDPTGASSDPMGRIPRTLNPRGPHLLTAMGEADLRAAVRAASA